MANPKLAYTNFFELGTVSATSETTGFEKENAYDGLTFDWWLPTAGSTNYLTVDNGSALSADYWFIYQHNLHENGGSVKLQYSTDNFSSSIVDVGTAVTPTDASPIFREFASISARYWRFEIITTSSPIASSYIGVAMIGPALELENTLPVDASNFLYYARDNVYINNVAERGATLGRSLIRKGLKGTINLRFITPSWFRSNWDNFMDHAEQKPFVFSSDPTNYPDESVLCYLEGKQTQPRPTSALYLNASLKIIGYR